MAISRSYTVANILQGPVDIYAGITAPSSYPTPTADTGCLTLDANGQPTSGAGSHMGSVEGPTSVVITEKSNEIMDDQHETAIDVAFDSIEAEIDITVKETVLTRLQTLMTSNVGAFASLSNSTVLQVGGKLDSAKTAITLLLVSPDRAVSGKFYYVMAYKCYLKSAIQAAFQRNKETVYKLKFGVFMDTARESGDELMQIVKTK